MEISGRESISLFLCELSAPEAPSIDAWRCVTTLGSSPVLQGGYFLSTKKRYLPTFLPNLYVPDATHTPAVLLPLLLGGFTIFNFCTTLAVPVPLSCPVPPRTANYIFLEHFIYVCKVIIISRISTMIRKTHRNEPGVGDHTCEQERELGQRAVRFVWGKQPLLPHHMVRANCQPQGRVMGW